MFSVLAIQKHFKTITIIGQPGHHLKQATKHPTISHTRTHTKNVSSDWNVLIWKVLWLYISSLHLPHSLSLSLCLFLSLSLDRIRFRFDLAMILITHCTASIYRVTQIAFILIRVLLVLIIATHQNESTSRPVCALPANRKQRPNQVLFWFVYWNGLIVLSFRWAYVIKPTYSIFSRFFEAQSISKSDRKRENVDLKCRLIPSFLAMNTLISHSSH